jgi:hypothetical protein
MSKCLDRATDITACSLSTPSILTLIWTLLYTSATAHFESNSELPVLLHYVVRELPPSSVKEGSKPFDNHKLKGQSVGKGKCSFLCASHESIRGARVQLYPFLTSTLDGDDSGIQRTEGWVTLTVDLGQRFPNFLGLRRP